jgi:hypothetical protein
MTHTTQNRILALSCLILLLIACNSKHKEPSGENPPASHIDSFLVTDSAWGLITDSSTIEDLNTIYGAANVKDERICGAECVDSVDVTIVNGEGPRSFIVYWEDSNYHKSISTINSGSDNSLFHTATGLKVGSSLNDLLKYNGKPITFYGFGWDYGGYVSSYQGGKMERSPISFRLDLAEGSDKLYGDGEFTTDMPEVKAALDKIMITEIMLSLMGGNGH